MLKVVGLRIIAFKVKGLLRNEVWDVSSKSQDELCERTYIETYSLRSFEATSAGFRDIIPNAPKLCKYRSYLLCQLVPKDHREKLEPLQKHIEPT